MSTTNADIWVLAEQNQGHVQRVTYELMTRGLELASKRNTGLSVMLFGNGVTDGDLQNMIDRGAGRVVYVEHPGLSDFLIEPHAAAMLDIIGQYQPEVILAAATTMGRSLMPYVAIKANTGLTADCTILDIDDETGNLLQTRPAIGGNIMATIKTPNHRPQMATVRPRSTAPAEVIGSRHGQIIKLTPSDIVPGRLTLRDFRPFTDHVSIADADVVVAVGRGIRKKENLGIIYELAEALGAAVGGTRDVVDRGWLSYSHQIGLSGQTISPKLYIGIGISGTIQHIAGMQTAETIVAINKDPDAQLFKIANYGIVGDLFDVVPALTEKIKNEGTLCLTR